MRGGRRGRRRSGRLGENWRGGGAGGCRAGLIPWSSAVGIRPPPLVFAVAKLGYRWVIRRAIACGRWLLSFLGQVTQRVAARRRGSESLSDGCARRSCCLGGRRRDRHSWPKSRLSLSLARGWVNECCEQLGCDDLMRIVRPLRRKFDPESLDEGAAHGTTTLLDRAYMFTTSRIGCLQENATSDNR